MSTTKNSAKTNSVMFDRLHNWNVWLSVLHAVQGVLILILSTSRTFPVTTNYLTTDTLQTQAAGRLVLAPATRQLFDVNIAYLVAVFFFISAIAHGLVASKLRSSYEDNLKKGLNKVRWVEYALSAGTMIVIVGMLVGVQDISALTMMFGLVVVMNLLGLAMELHNQGTKRPRWLVYIISCIAGVLPWAAIAMYLIGAGVYGSKAPAFVYWIFVTIFVLFASFAANMFLQYRKVGKWTNYLYGERVFMILSLVAKTALAWQLFAGSLRP